MPVDFFYDRLPSHPPKFNPRQFGMRSLLVLVTAVALPLGWYVRPVTPTGLIREKHVKLLRPGMTKAEVAAQLGPVKDRTHEPMHLWVYRIVDRQSKDHMLFVRFNAGGTIDSAYYWFDH